MQDKQLNLDNWKEYYQSRLVTAEEAVRAVKSGDRVFITYARDPHLLIQALVARHDELKDVKINMMLAQIDPGWCEPEMSASFQVAVETFGGAIARNWLGEHKCDFVPNSFHMRNKTIERPSEARPLDVLMTVVSPPDEHGYCSFGFAMWTKKQMIKTAKTVIVEVDENTIRTYGDNFIHVSEIDYFVQNTQPTMSEADVISALAQVTDEERRAKMKNILDIVDPVRRPTFLRHLNEVEMAELDRISARVGAGEPTAEEKQLAENVASLVQDGDTIQIGTGRPSARFANMGIFDNKLDLGVHSEVGFGSLARLMKAGVINGKWKTLHPGKVLMTALGGGTDEVEFFDNNPSFELYDVDYINNPKVILAHENLIAINNAISTDLTGQITAEMAFGTRLINGPGGQPDFALGAALSPGGRSITCLPTTALDGAVSRIVPILDEGTAITIPRNYADYVVTEYGIARLMGKTMRERADALITIAHPDFRTELQKEAQKLFYP